ncbi:DUF3500 domain-containing protein [Agrococcus beijingensis]|uniref:DUF3500 domain-containing protein n=1 Tax=Agrococcus beijingensis TaxID=3068634 RepID=UPI002741D502|nr:DUF3500 domain-containing protein [Agrococcus sp. REN33]
MSDQGGERLDDFFSTARVTGTDERIELAGTDFRPFLYPLDDETLAPWRGMGYQEFADARRDDRFLQALLDDWNALLDEPFVGVTSDGTVREGLYELPAAETGHDTADASADDRGIVAAAEQLLASLSDAERAELRHPLDAREWRAWSNPEFVFHRVGLRLEDLAEAQVAAVLAIVEASLSPAGYARVIEAMELNGFLGELTELPTILGERSYFFALYGDPASAEPWGWQLFGHHVAVHFVTVGGRHVVAPVFIGGEPALADGSREPLFAEREATALALAASLTDEQRASAVVFESVLDPRMPEGRLHPADERHLAGAFRDNRLIPYEGISAYDLDDEQWALVVAIVDDFLLLLRDDQRALTLADVEAHRDDTWFAWYSGTDGTEPFYLRIQSPVIVAELDHHAGVWLSNRVPQRFHVHTILRLPNGNDYGRAYIEQWRRRRTTTED